MKKIFWLTFLVLICIFLITSPKVAKAQTSFFEDWSGSDPTFPESFYNHPTGENWDTTVHQHNGITEAPWGNSRSFRLLQSPFDVEHAHDCSPPPSTHNIQEYENATFVCKQHMMTSIYGPNAAEIVLTPNHLLDI